MASTLKCKYLTYKLNNSILVLYPILYNFFPNSIPYGPGKYETRVLSGFVWFPSRTDKDEILVQYR